MGACLQSSVAHMTQMGQQRGQHQARAHQSTGCLRALQRWLCTQPMLVDHLGDMLDRSHGQEHCIPLSVPKLAGSEPFRVLLPRQRYVMACMPAQAAGKLPARPALQ